MIHIYDLKEINVKITTLPSDFGSKWFSVVDPKTFQNEDYE